MNTTQVSPKIERLRTFKTALNAVAAAIGATVKYMPRHGDGYYRLQDKKDESLSVDVQYTDYEFQQGVPRMYFPDERNARHITVLTYENLSKHIEKRWKHKLIERVESAEAERKDAAQSAAYESMVKFISDLLCCRSFKHTSEDFDDKWSSDRGTFELCYVEAKGDNGNYTFVYNIEFDFAVNPRLSDTRIKGEFEAGSSEKVQNMIRGILSMND